MGKIVLSSGMSSFNPENDNTFRAVFNRADQIMYKKKAQLKKAAGLM